FSVLAGIRSETEGLIYKTRLILKGTHKLFLSQVMIANHDRDKDTRVRDAYPTMNPFIGGWLGRLSPLLFAGRVVFLYRGDGTAGGHFGE
ncbi:MAG: hypothetical protein ACR65O_05520, partial [Methylomicrobium sp.]